MLTWLSRWGDGIEKIKHDTRAALSDDDAKTVDVCHATGLRHLEEGAIPLDLASIKYFPRFHITISRGRLDDERTTVDSVNTSAGCFFAKFTRINW